MYRKSWGKTPQPMEKKKEKQTETRQSNVHSSIDVIGEARPKTNPLLCVVQSYLQWLTDCDYDTNCSLCERPLADAETIRLQCLHLLHWSCLDEWARRFPATTAPAGYCCPFCREALFPAMNQTSPMIDELRTKLQQANWARAGLGLPLLPELEPTSLPPQQAHRPTSNSTSGPPHFNVVNNDGHFPVQSHANRAKYGSSTPDHFTGYKRVLIIALFLFLLLVTVIVVLTKAGIGAAEDPLLDPMNNPNIRVAVEGGVADSI
ncbi:zinc finger, C3HC4 type [Necator americanus]|uniref:Zinc finger protein-like 1 homolog n=1 Tax=Necator americanus TaxID=51031 RepID=W2TLX8_NECAM|nr:zinc finger, C3HC4 type [Necator americanus]ETN82141.1 zinc finger, C3HC4 type [Necator americanus]